MNSAAETLRIFLAAWTRHVHRRGAVVLMLSLLLAAAAVWFLATNIKINTDTADMLSPELPFRQNDKAVARAFPDLKRNILLVVDGASRDVVDDATARLTARIAERAELYGEVFDPAGDPFFQQNGLLFLSVDALEDLTERLAEAQPFLATLWGETTLPSFFNLLNMAMGERLKGNDVPLPLARVLNSIAEVAEAQAENRFGQLSWQDLISGEAKPGQRLLLIQPPLDFKTLSPAAKAMRELRKLRDDLALDGSQGARLRISGEAALKHEELKSVEHGIGLSGALSAVLVTVLLLVGLGSGRLALATVVTLFVGLIWTAGFAIFALGQLNLISVAFAVLFIGLSVDFGIHYGLRYREALDAGVDQESALAEAARGCGGALVLCAVAAGIAFYSFLPTDYIGLAELGLIAGTGMFIALFANLTVLPAVLALIPVRPKPGGAAAGNSLAAAANGFIRRNARGVLAAAALIALASLLAVPQARFDFDPLNLKDRKAESVATILDLANDSKTTPYVATVLADSLDQALALAEKLEALDEVAGTVTLKKFVPDDQEDKLEIIRDLSLLMGPSLPEGGGKGAASDADRQASVGALLSTLKKASSGDGETAAAAARLMSAIEGLPANGLAEFESRLLKAFPARIDALRTSLQAETFDAAGLPESVRVRNLTEDGRARLLIFPKEDLRDHQALERFVITIRGVAEGASGSPVTIFEAGRAVLSAFVEAGTIAFIAITVLLLVMLRTVVDTIYVFLPLTLAALLTTTCSVIFNAPLNFANVIVLPLLVGLGVASGIHLVSRDREERRQRALAHGGGDESGGDAFATSTPRAVLFSALTTIGSFASLALSAHAGTASMGFLLTIAVALTSACTLIVLPALLTLKNR